MYQTFINYDDEFSFYSGLVRDYQCQSVLEAGCGTGRLAPGFAAVKVDYTGMDLSEAMLTLARRNNSGTDFIKGDMRNFRMLKPTQSCIITGRSISYLVSDADVRDTFHAMYVNLSKPGLLCFDSIDAFSFLPSIEKGRSVIHHAVVGGKRYERQSFWKINSVQPGAFDWESIFYEEQADGSLTKIGEDQSTIRAFKKNEMENFLEDAGFKVDEIIPRPSYAFETFVIVARKK